MDDRRSSVRTEPVHFHYCCWLCFVSCSFFSLCISSHPHWASESCATHWGCRCSDQGTLQCNCQALVCGSGLPGFPPAEALVWFSSLLSKRCLPDKLEVSHFHTWVVMANVLKRYSREIDTWMMWCPRSYILYGKKWTEGNDGLTKGVGAGQVWISQFILHCLPRETITRTLSVQPT